VLNGWQAGDDPREGVHPYSVIVGRSERHFRAAADGWGHGWPVVHHVRHRHATDERVELTESFGSSLFAFSASEGILGGYLWAIVITGITVLASALVDWTRVKEVTGRIRID
jgi:hypothetical protein